MGNAAKINCPSCGHEVNVEEVLSQQIASKIQEENRAKLAALSEEFASKEKTLKEREHKIQAATQDLEHQVAEKVKAETALKETELKTKIDAEYQLQIQSLKDDGDEARKKVVELKTTQIENERLKREVETQRQNIELEYERKMNEQLQTETAAIRQREQEQSNLKIEELKKQLEDQKKMAEEMKRKAEQGSVQLQGEVQELELERMLRELYAREGDEISEVGKGKRGADLLQSVRTQGVECGKIYYESKRTKTFQNDWLQKLRDDNLEIKADVLVLVTETMPTGQKTFFQKDGIWICSLSEVSGLSLVLRQSIVSIHERLAVQQGKESKQEELYDFMTGPAFSAHFGAIIEGFNDLQSSYAKERHQMENLWNKRGKQLEKILKNAAGVYGAIQGISKAVPAIPLLELEADTLHIGHETA